MKCYFGGSQEPNDYEFVEACFANTALEAKLLMWTQGRLKEECDDDYNGARIIRKPYYDCLRDTKKEAPYIVCDQSTLREMGWGMDGDNRCDSCGLSEFEGEYPVCEDCCQCSDCGCDCVPENKLEV